VSIHLANPLHYIEEVMAEVAAPPTPVDFEQRASKIANITPQADEAAREADSTIIYLARLKIAARPAEAQVDAVGRIVRKGGACGLLNRTCRNRIVAKREASPQP
jgi:hypothetical protein